MVISYIVNPFCDETDGNIIVVKEGHTGILIFQPVWNGFLIAGMGEQ